MIDVSGLAVIAAVKRFPLFVSLLLLGGCGSLDASRPETEDDYPEVVATAQASGLEAFWLGPSFEAGGLTFDTIDSVYPKGAGGIEASGLWLSYLSIREDSSDQYTIRGVLDLKTFRQRDVEEIEAALRRPSRGVTLTWEAVSFAGIAGELGHGTIDGTEGGWLLIVPLGESVVFASVGPSLRGDGTQGNPLIDRDTFLAVMENLRPYPE